MSPQLKELTCRICGKECDSRQELGPHIRMKHIVIDGVIDSMREYHYDYEPWREQDHGEDKETQDEPAIDNPWKDREPDKDRDKESMSEKDRVETQDGDAADQPKTLKIDAQVCDQCGSTELKKIDGRYLRVLERHPEVSDSDIELAEQADHHCMNCGAVL